MSQQTWSKPAGCPPPRGSKDSSQLLTLMTGCCIRTMSWKKLNWLSKKFCVQSWQKKPWSEVVRFLTRVLDGALLRLASLRLKKITWIAVNVVVAMISVHSFASSPSPLSCIELGENPHHIPATLYGLAKRIAIRSFQMTNYHHHHKFSKSDQNHPHLLFYSMSWGLRWWCWGGVARWGEEG